MDDELGFCPRCFATTEDGSWSHTLMVNAAAGRSLCSNCGAGDSVVRLPRWAVESIRQQASWIGKRYYPSAEDHQLAAERRALLTHITEFPGRTAEPGPDSDQWRVTQPLPDGSTQLELVTATTAAAAIAATRYSLTYVPA